MGVDLLRPTGPVDVRLESDENGDDPTRPLFRAEVWQDDDMIAASAWTIHPRRAEREVSDFRRIYRAWIEVQEELALSA